METTRIDGIKCPKCGGEQVICSKRGYSFLWGIIGAVLTMIAYMLYWIISTGFSKMSISNQDIALSIVGNGPFIFAFLLGLLWGLVGKNKLIYQCASCGKRFERFDMNKNANGKFNKVIFISLGVVLILLLIFLLMCPSF